MKEKVMIFGSFVVDLMSRATHLPKPGETVRGNEFNIGPGGKGFNQAVASHKSGADIITVTKIGNDTFGKIALDIANDIGMNSKGFIISEKDSTGSALICVDEITAENQILIVPGACNTIQKEEIDSLDELLDDVSYLLIQYEVNQDANEYIIKKAIEKGAKIILNPAPYQKVNDEFLANVNTITPNETEVKGLTGVEVIDLETARQAKDVLLSKGIKNVVITLGVNGSYIYSDGKDLIIPSYKVTAVDTTGAGDAFNGGLLTSLSEGNNLFDAAKFATAVSALSVQKKGTAISMPTREEIDLFIEKNN